MKCFSGSFKTSHGVLHLLETYTCKKIQHRMTNAYTTLKDWILRLTVKCVLCSFVKSSNSFSSLNSFWEMVCKIKKLYFHNFFSKRLCYRKKWMESNLAVNISVKKVSLWVCWEQRRKREYLNELSIFENTCTGHHKHYIKTEKQLQKSPTLGCRNCNLKSNLNLYKVINE